MKITPGSLKKGKGIKFKYSSLLAAKEIVNYFSNLKDVSVFEKKLIK
jgi:hypothetical protein